MAIISYGSLKKFITMDRAMTLIGIMLRVLIFTLSLFALVTTFGFMYLLWANKNFQMINICCYIPRDRVKPHSAFNIFYIVLCMGYSLSTMLMIVKKRTCLTIVIFMAEIASFILNIIIFSHPRHGAVQQEVPSSTSIVCMLIALQLRWLYVMWEDSEDAKNYREDYSKELDYYNAMDDGDDDDDDEDDSDDDDCVEPVVAEMVINVKSITAFNGCHFKLTDITADGYDQTTDNLPMKKEKNIKLTLTGELEPIIKARFVAAPKQPIVP